MSVRGGAEFRAAVERMIVAAEQAATSAVMQGAHKIEAAAKQHSSGRPGPYVGGSNPAYPKAPPGGAHRRSIHVEGPTVSGSKVSAQVGPSMIYSRRLELGYSGTDAKGRIYKQPPYPSLQPGLDDAEKMLEELFVRAWAGASEGA